MYDYNMHKKIKMKVVSAKCPYDLPNPEEEKKMIERTKPSVERRKTKSEEKYNDFVKKLYTVNIKKNRK